jgi:hypothetical protein
MGNEACERFTPFHHHHARCSAVCQNIVACVCGYACARACVVRSSPCAFPREQVLLLRAQGHPGPLSAQVPALLRRYLHHGAFLSCVRVVACHPSIRLWPTMPDRGSLTAHPTSPPPDHPRLHLRCLLVRFVRWLHL